MKEYKSDGVTLMDEMGTVLMIINYFLFYLMMILFINILNHHFSNIKGVRIFSLSFGIIGLLFFITASIAAIGNDFTFTMALWVGGSMVPIEVVCLVLYYFNQASENFVKESEEKTKQDHKF